MQVKNFFLIVILLLICTIGNVYAQDITKIVINKTNNKIFVSASLDEDIPEEIFEYLHNGVKVTIVYEINLYRKTPFFYITDSKIKKIAYKKIVKYNMWEKNYYLYENEGKVKIPKRKILNNKLKFINNIFVIDINQLEKNEEYYIRVKASLESVKLFPPLSWIFGLVSTTGFETSWENIDIK